MRSILALLTLVSAHAFAADLTVRVKDTTNAVLADAVVYLVPASGSASISGKSTDVDQVDREFVPKVTVVQTGTAIYFPNSDNIRHQVYSFSPAKTFQLKLYSGRPSSPVVFDQPGLVVLGCNIHDHMIAYVIAVPTPWFARSGASGSATIRDLPSGDYALHAWSEGLQAPMAVGSISIANDSALTRDVIVPRESSAVPTGAGGR